ncbi:hypothetical protein DPMN_006478, partial [Dreissena polymorpha]
MWEHGERFVKKLKTNNTPGSATSKEEPCDAVTPVTPESGYGSATLTPESNPSDDTEKQTTVFEQRTNVDKLKTFLQRNFRRLKEEIDPQELSDYLHQNGVISTCDIEKVYETKGRRNKVDVMIKAIVNSKDIFDTQTTSKVFDGFASIGRSDLVETFHDDFPTEEAYTVKDTFTKAQAYTLIKKYWHMLKNEVEPLLVIDSLLEKMILNFAQHENIRESGNFNPTRMALLCAIVLDKPPIAFLRFCEVLKETRIYENIGQALLNHKAEDITELTLPNTMPLEIDLQLECSIRVSKKNDHSDTEITIDLGSKELEEMIVEHYEEPSDLQYEAMELGFDVEDVTFSSIKIRLKGFTDLSDLNLMQRLHIHKVLKSVITAEHFKLMREKNLKSIAVTVLTRGNPSNFDEETCFCKLKKEDIVKNFSTIEQRLKHVGTFVKAITESNLVTDAQKKEWFEAKTDVDTCLRLLIDGDDRCVCLLEKHLRGTGQNNLLKDLTANNVTVSTSELLSEDIWKQREVIIDELEPKRFMNMLRDIDGSAAIVDVIMNKDLSRRVRCDAMVTFLENKGATKQFQEELEKQKMYDLINLLKSKNDTLSSRCIDQVKETLISSMDVIFENIEPWLFKKYLVKEPEFSEKEFEIICKHTERKRRVFLMMQKILKGDEILIARFMNALEQLRYTGPLKHIKEITDKYHGCPRLLTKDKSAEVVWKSHVKFKTCIHEKHKKEEYLSVPAIGFCDKTEKLNRNPVGVADWINQIPAETERPEIHIKDELDDDVPTILELICEEETPYSSAIEEILILLTNMPHSQVKRKWTNSLPDDDLSYTSSWSPSSVFSGESVDSILDFEITVSECAEIKIQTSVKDGLENSYFSA